MVGYFQSNPSVICNVFKKPGIVDAIEGQQASTCTGATTSEDDPFISLDCQDLHVLTYYLINSVTHISSLYTVQALYLPLVKKYGSTS